VFSAIFLVLIELLFVGIYLLPFTKSCILCLSVGAVILTSSVHDAFPSTFAALKAFDIGLTMTGSTNRIRTPAEISAFLATVLSVWTRFAEFVFKSVNEARLISVLLTIALFAFAFFFTFLVGDFSFVWIWFHATFVIPGILLLPRVQRWLGDIMDDREEAQLDTDINEVPGDAAAGQPGPDAPAAAGNEPWDGQNRF
jgi:Flp pilus assembly protein TadB